MSEQAFDNMDSVVQFAPTTKMSPGGSIIADDSGHTIIALLKKAAEMAKEDCARAMDVAHKLSFQIRAAEERAREAEAEAAHFRDRATRAEAWMLRIRDEVEQSFFQRKDREQRQAPSHRNFPPRAAGVRSSG
jgi:hypothetical protein